MKKCSYCGAEYPDDAVRCAIDHTPFELSAAPSPTEPRRSDNESRRPDYEFANLSLTEQQQDWVTLVKCGTLVAADLIMSRLRAAGIEAFLPDEFLMQAVGWNFNTYGFVRVQVSPKDYESARNLLTG